MKVLMISPGEPNYHTSGAGVVVSRISAELSKKTSLTVIQPEDVNMDANQNVAFEDASVVEDLVHVSVKGAISPYLYEDRSIKSEEVVSHVQTELQLFTANVLDKSTSLDFDIIYAHDWVTFEAALQLKILTGKPLVVHIHSLDVDRISSVNHSWIFDLEKHAFEQADSIITVSQYTANRIHSYYSIAKEKLNIVYSGVELPSEIDYKKIFNDPVVLFVGRLSGQKGPQLFIEIAEGVLSKNPNVRFIVTGEGELKHDLLESAAHKGIGDRIHFTGYLDKEEMEKVYAESTIYCMPSLSEPFGLSAMEAAAAGLHLVLSNQSGASEVLPDALLAEPTHPEQFVEHIIGLIESGDTDKLEKNIDAIRNLTWDKTASKILDVLNKAL